MEKRTALAPEELAGLYRRHIQMVYQICLLMLKKRSWPGCTGGTFRWFIRSVC